jgi:hypothetical protein
MALVCSKAPLYGDDDDADNLNDDNDDFFGDAIDDDDDDGGGARRSLLLNSDRRVPALHRGVQLFKIGKTYCCAAL